MRCSKCRFAGRMSACQQSEAKPNRTGSEEGTRNSHQARGCGVTSVPTNGPAAGTTISLLRQDASGLPPSERKMARVLRVANPIAGLGTLAQLAAHLGEYARRRTEAFENLAVRVGETVAYGPLATR